MSDIHEPPWELTQSQRMSTIPAKPSCPIAGSAIVGHVPFVCVCLCLCVCVCVCVYDAGRRDSVITKAEPLHEDAGSHVKFKSCLPRNQSTSTPIT